METIIWLFTIYCTASCIGPKITTNEYFYSNSYENCIQRAKDLINLKGLTGTLEIECKPYQRKIVVRPAQGN